MDGCIATRNFSEAHRETGCKLFAIPKWGAQNMAMQCKTTQYDTC